MKQLKLYGLNFGSRILSIMIAIAKLIFNTLDGGVKIPLTQDSSFKLVMVLFDGSLSGNMVNFSKHSI